MNKGHRPKAAQPPGTPPHAGGGAQPSPRREAERAFWEAGFVAVARALSVQPGRHMLDGQRLTGPRDVAALAAQVADAGVAEWRTRFPEEQG